MKVGRDPQLERLAALLRDNFPLEEGLDRVLARNVRAATWELAADFGVGEDVSKVSNGEWVEQLRWEHGNVRLLLDLLIQAAVLRREGGGLIVADWEAVSADESAAAGRRWSRTMGRKMGGNTEQDSKVTSIDVARFPGEGFAQQDLFCGLITRIDDEDDLLVKFFRCLRMCVGGRVALIDEDTWQQLLETGHIVLDGHERRSDIRDDDE